MPDGIAAVAPAPVMRRSIARDPAGTGSKALSDRYFAFEPWLIGALFTISGGLALYLIWFLLVV